jgi:DNA-binding MarR family transcriptional regulator
MDQQQSGTKPDALEIVIATLGQLGQTTASEIATEAGLAYSTATAKLRALHDAGRAQRLRSSVDGRTLWRLTPVADATAAPAASDIAADPATPIEDSADDLDHQPTSADDVREPGEATDPDDDQPSDTAPHSAPATAPTRTGTTEAHDPANADTNDNDNQQAGTRRGKGALREAVLKILQNNPDNAYKVNQLSKLLDGASQGAIANALHKLAADGTACQTVERPATFQAV